MGVITRESSAPITDGEDLEAATVELEFAKIFTLMNGGIDTTNLSATAALVGTQLADGTIPSGKVTASTLTTAQMAASAVPKASVETADISGTMTTSATLIDVPTVSSITLTPGSTNDIVTMMLSVSIGPTGGAACEYNWGFNISDGTGDVEVGVSTMNTTRADNTYTFMYAMTATTAVSTVYKPRYKKNSGTAGTWQSALGLDHTCLFHVAITPMKS